MSDRASAGTSRGSKNVGRPFVLLPALLLLLVPGLARAEEEPESTCVSCHAQDEDEDMRAPVEEWRRGVHAAVDVSCDACHGGDPHEEDEDLSMDEDEAGFLGSPGWTEVTDFCGACHEEIAKSYRRSRMGNELTKTNAKRVAVCTTCHMTDGHTIHPPDPTTILTEKRCKECHSGKRAVRLRTLLVDVNAKLAHAQAGIDEIHTGIDTSQLAAEVGALEKRSYLIAHTYDAERIEEMTHVADQRLAAVESDTATLREQMAYRRRLGAGVVAFLAACSMGAAHLRRQVDGRSARSRRSGRK